MAKFFKDPDGKLIAALGNDVATPAGCTELTANTEDAAHDWSAWSPLARGRLTRPWGETTARLVSDEVGKNLYNESDENDAQIAARLTGVSEELGVTRAQVALAWLLSKPGVAAPIIGSSREEQLDELLNAVDLTLKPEQIAELETPYKQHPVVGFK